MSTQHRKRISTFGSQLTSIISVSLVLLLLGITAMLGITAKYLTDDVRRNLGFIAKMNRSCEKSDIDNVKRVLADAPFVESFVYSSADDILAQESKYMGDNISEFVQANPYSAEFDIKVRPEYGRLDSIEAIADKVAALKGVEEILTESAIIEGVDTAMRRASTILLSVAAALLLISFVLINNTVNLSIYSRRFLIHTMKLVGATTAFIRRPFVVAGAVNGLISAAVAAVLLVLLRIYAASAEPMAAVALTWTRMGILIAGVAVCGVVICSLAAIISTNRFLRSSYDEMYLK